MSAAVSAKHICERSEASPREVASAHQIGIMPCGACLQTSAAPESRQRAGVELVYSRPRRVEEARAPAPEQILIPVCEWLQPDEVPLFRCGETGEQGPQKG